MSASAPSVDSAAGFQLVAICVAASIACELLLWGWAYSKPEFRTLRDTVERLPRLPDGTLAAAAAESPAATAASSSKDRKAGRAGASLKHTLLTTLAPVKLKTMAVGLVATIYLIKVSGRAAGKAVAVLPFQATAPPLSWLARRGLPADEALTACAAALLFALVQAGVRPAVARLLDAGPTTKMNELQMAFTPGLAAGAAAAQAEAARKAQ